MKNEQLYEKTLLVVDDEPGLLEMVKLILEGAGFCHIKTAADCREARVAFALYKPDAVLLDVMLPDGDGFILLEEFRRQRDVPVLFLSARDEDEARLKGLGSGGDDYITKPFLARELILRLLAVLRRVYAHQATGPQKPAMLRLGSAVVDWGSGTVTTEEKQSALTAKEYLLLKKLWENRGNIVTFDSLCQAAWGDDFYGYENTLMVHIRRLREKIEPAPSSPRFLLTVRGLGYRLVKEAPCEAE